MKTLVIGTGGREHALALALSRDPAVTEVHAAPGNPGIAAVATLHDVDPLDGEAVADLAESLGADLVVVGPEAPLVAGVADAVRDARDRLLRPVARGRPARGLQGLRQGRHGRGRGADRDGARLRHRRARSPPRSTRSARRTSSRTTGSPPARASSSPTTATTRSPTPRRASGCVIEEFLDGPEVSLFAITDGDDRLPAAAGPGLQAGRRRRRRAPTPAAWAPTRRCRGRRPSLVAEVLERVLAADRRRDGPARHPLRRACSTPAWRSPRAASAVDRVQRPLRRPGDPAAAGAAATRRSPALLNGAADRHARPRSSRRAGSDGAAVAVVMAARGLPRVRRARAT